MVETGQYMHVLDGQNGPWRYIEKAVVIASWNVRFAANNLPASSLVVCKVVNDSSTHLLYVIALYNLEI